MAEIVGVFAASHAPPLVRDWNSIEKARKQGLDFAFFQLGRRIQDANPDIILAVGTDHWANFFLDNMPAICVGLGAEHGGPPEDWLSDYPHPAMIGHPQFALHLAEQAFAQGFELSVSYRMKLDHAFCVPLWKAGINPLPAIVPIMINAIQNPVPNIPRCLALGTLIADAVESFSASTRVVVLATGGLSHSVGEPAMGEIDEQFDRGCIERLANRDPASLMEFLSEERIARAGNGASEVRFWMVAHGAARCSGFGLIHYEAVPETYTGCCFAQWKLRSSSTAKSRTQSVYT
jgi:aromatic ring-opening dioxygenase catalytic subunit (LigB family)